MLRRFSFFITLIIVFTAKAADPTATAYSFAECAGSRIPYPTFVAPIETPDSMTPVFINHVGRHGARFPASSRNVAALNRALQQADSLGTITQHGRDMLALTRLVLTQCADRWGALDSLGMAEERGIASRMYLNYPKLLAGARINALSSYSPRCVASMYEFTHQLDRLNNTMEIYTSAGRQNSDLMRPFDLDADFRDYIESKVWETPLNDVIKERVDAAPLKRILGNDFPLTSAQTRELAMAEYEFVSSLGAMSIDIDPADYFTLDEYNNLWSCTNLKLYLQRTANTLSSEPAIIASPLLLNLIRTTDEAVEGRNAARVMLRFGHAETLLPLLSMMRIGGCNYFTNYFDTVGQHFRDFDIVPMGANLQIVLFKTAKGRYYVRFDLNEKPITLIPGDSRIYLPWTTAREYLIKCLPLIDQP